jgi:mono/diheme cytochrome c family protein
MVILILTVLFLAACDAPKLQGEEIYQRTAGGIGCQSCHGVDGKGSNLGPGIRGASVDDINRALAISDTMSSIFLTDEEVEAVATYLKHLESQP